MKNKTFMDRLRKIEDRLCKKCAHCEQKIPLGKEYKKEFCEQKCWSLKFWSSRANAMYKILDHEVIYCRLALNGVSCFNKVEMCHACLAKLTENKTQIIKKIDTVNEDRLIELSTINRWLLLCVTGMVALMFFGFLKNIFIFISVVLK